MNIPLFLRKLPCKKYIYIYIVWSYFQNPISGEKMLSFNFIINWDETFLQTDIANKSLPCEHPFLTLTSPQIGAHFKQPITHRCFHSHFSWHGLLATRNISPVCGLQYLGPCYFKELPRESRNWPVKTENLLLNSENHRVACYLKKNSVFREQEEHFCRGVGGGSPMHKTICVSLHCHPVPEEFEHVEATSTIRITKSIPYVSRL